MKPENQNTPEKVCQRFFDSWVVRDWTMMVSCVQKTWLDGKENPAEVLEGLFGKTDGTGLRIIGTEYVSAVMADIVIQATTGGIKIRAICETGVRKPSINGTWGINPISFREDKQS